MMSRKSTIWKLIALLSFCCGITVLSSSAVYGDDDVIEYYWQKARKQFLLSNLTALGLSYEVTITTYYKTIGDKGTVSMTDSATVRYFFQDGSVDSMSLVEGNNEKFSDLNLSVPDLFGIDFLHYAYPNDTGGTDIAIGLDTDSGSTDPDGFVLINRSNYDISWLYLHYPAERKLKRFSRSMRFARYGDYIYPDSIWEVGTEEGVFQKHRFRIESRIDSLEVFK